MYVIKLCVVMKDLWAFNDQSPGKKNLAGAEALGIDVRRNSVKSVHCSNAENGLSLCAASWVTDLLYIWQRPPKDLAP
jgi:hypothetical protein